MAEYGRIEARAGDQPTLPMRSLQESTERIDFGFHVALDSPTLDVFPASSGSIEISITNTGGEDLGFSVAVDGLPENWSQLSQTQGRIPSADTAFVLLNVRPPHRADNRPADHHATITVTATDQRHRAVQRPLLVRCHGFGGLSMALEPTVIHDEGPIELFLLNQGSEELRLNLHAIDPQDRLHITLSQTSVQLAPGQRFSVRANASLRRRLLAGKSHAIPFALLAQADNPSAYQAALPASVHVKPRMSIAMAVLLTLLLAAAAYLLIHSLIIPISVSS